MASSDAEKQLAAERLADRWLAAQPAVAAYIRAEVKNRHDAEDVLQEVGKAVMSSSSRYDDTRPITNWMFGIARNQVLQYFRQRSKDRAIFSSDFVEGLAVTYDSLLPTLSERRDALEECLQKLKATQRQILQMYYREELPQLEIARQLCISKSAVGVLMYRARTALKDCVHRRLSKESG